MRWISSSIVEHVKRQLQQAFDSNNPNGKEIRAVLPSAPPNVVVNVATALSDFIVSYPKRITLHIKVAYPLGERWQGSGVPSDIEAFRFIQNKGWYDDMNSLTRYRNYKCDPNDEFLVLVLIGVDQVTDQSSLADFYSVTNDVIWTEQMDESFESWLTSWLGEKHIAYESDQVAQIDELLCVLCAASIADLTNISIFMDSLDVSGAQDARDILRLMGFHLHQFGLPVIHDLSKISKRNGLRDYIIDAIKFSGYADYMDETKRKKTLQAVDVFKEKVDRGEITVDADDLGNYTSLNGLLEDLHNYISRQDLACRKRLLGANFVYVRDHILRARRQKGQRSRTSVKRLTGSPLEVVLEGVWATLRDFKDEQDDLHRLAQEAISAIHIRGLRFRHDCDGENTMVRAENAKGLLLRCIGGLDEVLEKHLQIAPDPNASDHLIEVRSVLCPQTKGNDMDYAPAGVGEPGLQFAVELVAKDGALTKREFQWRFPEIHPYRNAEALFGWLYRELEGRHDIFPVFVVPFYTELMLTRSEEDANRILLQCLESRGCHVLNLLDAAELPPDDPLLPDIRTLAFQYGLLVKKFHEAGFYVGLEAVWPMIEAYRKVYEGYITRGSAAESCCGPLLFKAFLMLGPDVTTRNDRWFWDPYEPSAAVTVLHPSLLEMLLHQQAFLCDGFCYAVKEDLAVTRSRSFSERKWAHILDLSKVKLPLTGILRDADRKLVTQIQDNGLLHLIGDPPETETTLTTRVLLRYEGAEEEEITDTELFHTSRNSTLIERILSDYVELHPQARDGLSLAAYCGGDHQPLIAGVDAFLQSLVESRTEDVPGVPYNLSLTVFAESTDDTDIVRWLREWRDRWESAGEVAKYAHYGQCNISVAHRLITRDSDYAQLRKILAESFGVDVVFLMNFIRAGDQGNEFREIEPYPVTENRRKFPILEKVSCALDMLGHRNRRERVISNRQFRLATLHAEVMTRLKEQNTPPGQHHVVMGIGDFSPWEKVVDDLHKRSAWVVCIDPCVDERLVGKVGPGGQWQREIIGFGSGVGAHGEQNYTVSTEFFRLADLKEKISIHIGEILGPWTPENNDLIARGVLEESRRVSGLSLVKATGPSEYIRDYVAYAMIRKMLPRQTDIVCDEIVSLDAFRHWFDDAPTARRPDLLHLRAILVNGTIDIFAHLIECKLARQAEMYLEEAHEQLENGLRHLIDCFRPRGNSTTPTAQKPDQRYWWLQLHRLIASKSQVKQAERSSTIAAMEKLSEGYFNICWRATAVTFWSDSDNATCTQQGTWDFDFEGQPLQIDIVSAGRNVIKDVCLGARISLPLSDSQLCLSGRGLAVPLNPEEAGGAPMDLSIRHVIERSKTEVGRIQSEVSVSMEAVSPNSFIGQVKVEVPKRIYLGTDASGSRRVFWEFGHNQLANRHLLIFGSSGMGKTYAIQAILCELAKDGQNSLIVDYTNGFEDHQIEPLVKTFLRPTQHRVQWEPVPINPFRRQINVIGNERQPEKVVTTAQRVQSVFGSVYGLGDQQKSALYQAVKVGIEKYGDTMRLDKLPEMLQAMVDSRSVPTEHAVSVLSKIQPFVDGKPFGEEKPDSWESLFSDQMSRCHILQLVGSSKDFARLVTEFSLIDLYWYYRGSGDKDHPRVVVLDEVQNLDHKLDSPLGSLLTEGRKFGFSLILATQAMSNLKQDEQDRMFQAAHKLFFRPAETEVREYATILTGNTGDKIETWINRLSALKQGECYSLGPSVNQTGVLESKCFKIKIAALETRFPQEGQA